jgi:anhydro-N-acetylmuramic acid kinase
MPAKILPRLLHKRPLYIIGLNSGTSADGIDLALVRFNPSKKPEVMDSQTYSYPMGINWRILALAEPESVDGEEWLALDYVLGNIYGHCVRRFASKMTKAGGTVDLVGSHGQTIRHLPGANDQALTLQVGDPALIAEISGLPVVADFRRSDIAAGGEGAPLSPILHEALFRSKTKWRAIVNIGGIANVTILPPLNSRQKPIAGDSGPGNMLIDMAMRKLFARHYDFNGRMAQKGKANSSFVAKTLKTPFFRLRPPKSTGRELFGASFLKKAMSTLRGLRPEDLIATLTEITISSIADFIERFGPKIEEIYLCGGGAKNRYILNRLRESFAPKAVETTTPLGYDSDYLEALLWAHLAYCFIDQRHIDAANYTGARNPYIPGKLCLP